jgi:hypothetical protein
MPTFGTIVDLNTAAKNAGTAVVFNELIAGSFKTFESVSTLSASMAAAPDRFETDQIVYVSASDQLFIISKSLDSGFNPIIDSSSFSFPGSGGGGNPGGSSTQIQFNNGGNFAGSPKLTFNSSTGLTKVTGSLKIDTLDASQDIFLIKSGSRNIAKVTKEGTFVLVPVTGSALTPFSGGLMYSSSALYVGAG